MKKPSLKGMQNTKYLGHFAQDKFLAKGHNSNGFVRLEKRSRAYDAVRDNENIPEKDKQDVEDAQEAYRRNSESSVYHSMTYTGEPFTKPEDYSAFPFGRHVGEHAKFLDDKLKASAKRIADAADRKKRNEETDRSMQPKRKKRKSKDY